MIIVTGDIMDCTVCKESYFDKQHWNRHLLESGHQQTAKGDLRQWDPQLRQCGVILYSSFSLRESAAALKVIQEISERWDESAFVTDFVLYSSRPRTAILQLESEGFIFRRAKVTDLLLDCGGSSIRVDNQVVQMRRLSELLELEWLDLLDNIDVTPTPEVTPGRETPTGELLKRKVSVEETSDKGSPPRKYRSLQQPVQVPEVAGFQFVSNVMAAMTIAPTPAVIRGSDGRSSKRGKLEDEDSIVVITIDPYALSEEFELIQQQMQVPEAEVEFVSQVVAALQKKVAETGPSGVVVEIYRNNHLKLRNNLKSNAYLIYLYLEEASEIGWTLMTPDLVKGLNDYFFKGDPPPTVDDPDILQSLDAVKGRSQSEEAVEGEMNPGDMETLLSHKPSGILLKYNFWEDTLVELQLSRLVQYYCQFDSRVRPLLSLVFYWAKLNNLTLTSYNSFQIPEESPDTAALEWLILFFLCNSQRVIPAPRDIFQRPHSPLLYPKNGAGQDIGFNPHDLEYVARWRKETNNPREASLSPEVDVLNLLREFFLFCAHLQNLHRATFLNTRDGEVVTLKREPQQLWVMGPQGRCVSCPHTSLSERKYIRRRLLTTEVQNPVMIAHPLIFDWWLPVHQGKWRGMVSFMKKAAANLKNVEQNVLLGGSMDSLEKMLFVRQV